MLVIKQLGQGFFKKNLELHIFFPAKFSKKDWITYCVFLENDITDITDKDTEF